MPDNKLQPTTVTANEFLGTVSETRQLEAQQLIAVMQEISGLEPVMWGPSIIGFGSQHYTYESGREGDMPRLAFSPRKSAITVYFNEGFDRYGELMTALGKHTASVSCLYINKLTDVRLDVLRQMLAASYELGQAPRVKPASVDEYIASVPAAARKQFDALRKIVKEMIPEASEVLSYGIIGYKIDDKRARVFVSGWKDHLAVYPVPHDDALQADLQPYIKGKGTLWFALDKPLPVALIQRVVTSLVRP